MPSIDKVKFSTWLAVKKHLKDSSIFVTDTRLKYINNWIGKRKLSSDLAEEFVLYVRQKGRRNGTINSYIRIFSLIDEFYREQGIDLNLLKKIEYFPKQRKVPTILSIEEVQAIIDAPGAMILSDSFNLKRRDFINKMMRLSVWLLASTGCRFNEMASLKKENLHIGIDKNYVEIKDPKNSCDRQVPIPENLAQLLVAFTQGKKPNDLIFTSGLKHKLQEQTFNPLLRRKVERAGVNKHVHAHAFRHSFIMEHLRRGSDPLSIAKLCGHESVDSTLDYCKFEMSDLENTQKNHPLFSQVAKPEVLLEKISQEVVKWPILNDKRFQIITSKANNSFKLEVTIKN